MTAAPVKVEAQAIEAQAIEHRQAADRAFAVQRFALRDIACLRGERLLFSGLDLDLPAGGAVLLTGPNGAGKSSLLRLIAGLLPPFQGTFLWDGTPTEPDDDAHRRRLIFVGHQDALKPALTVAETLRFWVDLHGPGLPGSGLPGSGAVAGRRHGEAAVTAGLTAFGIAPLADAPTRYLSAGQRRRLGLARLAAIPAPLWLLDEPGTALDRASLAVLASHIAAHRAAGGMVILSTHGDLAADAALAGAIAVDLGGGPSDPEAAAGEGRGGAA